MPHALLLSPDDQAVSAITGVLEEMSVSCERPLDGVSAAQKLNSHSFDLVLVDCENLPAAKLIFDVCRRGKGGANPVPIAIVDGRAGLPTAFRLGAELILTKPVAKDQARSTIRTAVGRLRKDEPARVSQPVESAAAEAVAPAPSPAPAEERAQAAAAGFASQAANVIEVSPPAAPIVPAESKMSVGVEEIAGTTDTLKPVSQPSSSSLSLTELSPAQSVLANSKSAPPMKPSDDPVLAELERCETEPPAPVFSSYAQPQKKGRGPLVALMVVALAGGGFYAAWMYQPGFRAMAEPQLERVLALAGMARQQQSTTPPAPAPIPATSPPAAATASLPPSASPADAVNSARPVSTVTSSPAPPPADVGTANPQTVPAATEATTPARVAAEPAEPSDSRKSNAVAAPSVPSESALPDEKNAVILSSKGAEKRLVRHLQPIYPKEAASAGVDGTVVLKTVVDVSGKVESVRLVEGSPTLAAAAISAVKQWRYRPYVRDGKTLPFQTIVLVDFQRP